MKKYFEILKKCPLFFGIGDESMSGMLACLGARVRTYEKKEAIISEGDDAKYVGILLSGSAKIIQVDYFGNRSIVSEVGPCETFAEAFAYAGSKIIPVSIIADERCDVMFIDCIRITQPCCNACDFHRQLILNLMRSMASKNLMYHQRMEITSKRSTREKLLTYLMMQAKKNHANSFDIPYDRQELADFLEVDRSGLSAEISKMRKEGIIKSDKNHFELLKYAI